MNTWEEGGHNSWGAFDLDRPILLFGLGLAITSMIKVGEGHMMVPPTNSRSLVVLRIGRSCISHIKSLVGARFFESNGTILERIVKAIEEEEEYVGLEEIVLVRMGERDGGVSMDEEEIVASFCF